MSLKVGPNEKLFAVQPQLLERHCPLFDNGASNIQDGNESKETLSIISMLRVLSKIDEDIFSFIVEYLYTGTINPGSTTNVASALQRVNIWKAAEALCMPKVQTLIMKHLRDEFSHAREYDCALEEGFVGLILACYNDTKPGSPLRRWVSDLVALG